MNLPPFPSLPSSPQERLRWIAWGEECARMRVPEGYALVPIEPTQAMLDAVAPFPEHLRAEHPDPADDWHARMAAATRADQWIAAQTYRDMIAAIRKEPE